MAYSTMTSQERRADVQSAQVKLQAVTATAKLLEVLCLINHRFWQQKSTVALAWSNGLFDDAICESSDVVLLELC